MRKKFFKAEKYRVRDRSEMATETGDRFGAFEILANGVGMLRVIASEGDEEIHWEHVSVSLHHRCPTWEEMCMVKRLFWEDSETVLQFHPKQEKYINQHEFVLHLWKLRGVDHKLPPSKCV